MNLKVVEKQIKQKELKSTKIQFKLVHNTFFTMLAQIKIRGVLSFMPINAHTVTIAIPAAIRTKLNLLLAGSCGNNFEIISY